MLVLSRQRDETIMIGDEIEITVVDIRGDKIRLGISAPAKIAVHRKEVYDAIRRENQRAATLGASEVSDLTDAISAGPQRRKLSGMSQLTQRAPAKPTTTRVVRTKNRPPRAPR